MKFAIIVVMLALAMGAQSSILPYPLAAHGHALSYTAVSGPALLPAHHAAVAVHAHAPLWGHGYGLAHGPVLAHGPAIAHHAAYHGVPAVAVHAAPVLAHEGTYVAKTRGAVHTAPLAGHINSAASINLQPAPGTI